jgi:amino acid adenylation domain-containing protein
MRKDSMMTATLLGTLLEAGVRFEVHGERLKYHAPKGMMTPELLKQLTESRLELMAFLQEHATETQPVPEIVGIPRTSTRNWPLSFSQQRLWFLDQIDAARSAYNVPITLRMKGNLDIHAFENALNRVVARHEILRTHFVSEQGKPVQIIHPALKVKIPVMDLSQLPAETREAEAGKLAIEDRLQPFRLDCAPLLRITLVRLDAEEHWIICTMHHIISDGWSMGVLVREITALYRQELGAGGAALPELPVQYADYAFWQRSLGAELFHTQLEYWANELGDLPALELPTDRARGTVRRGGSGEYSFRFSAGLKKDLEKLGYSCGATLFMTLLAVLQVLLGHYSGQEDIAVGSPVANRMQPEVEGLIGFFINMLVLRTKVNGDPAFRQFLNQVRDRTLQAYAHQDVPFELVVNRLQPQRSNSRTPLFNVLFILQNAPRQVLSLPELTIEELPIRRRENPYELMLAVTPNQDQLEAVFSYDTDLFEPATIKQYAADFLALLKTVAATPDACLSEIVKSVSSAELLLTSSRSSTVAIHRTYTRFPDSEIEQSLVSRFLDQVKRWPGHTAIKGKDREWTYHELNQAADHAAQALLDRKKDSERVALLFEHDAPMVIGMFGVLKAAKTYVPLDPSHPAERLKFMMNDAGVTVILTNNASLALASVLAEDGIDVLSLDQLPSAPHEATADDPGPLDLACIIYSSGSTGIPKGTLQSHRAMLHIIANYTNSLHLSETDRCLVLASYAHVMAMIDIYAALLNGATLYPFNVKEQGTADLAGFIHSHDITIYRSNASLFRSMIDSAREGIELMNLRAVVLGAEPVLASDFDLYCKYCSADCVLVNTYGSTEATVSVMEIMDKQASPEGDILPIGHPVGENQVLLLSPSGRPTPFYGEVAIRNPYLPSGYWNREHESERAFYQDKAAPGMYTYRTGDLARKRLDGSLVLVGRIDQQVKLRGFRIELGEIEAVLKQHSSVNNAVVLVVDDKSGNKRLRACIVPGAEQPSKQLLLEHARKHLPDYMVPTSFVVVHSLPLTPNGKLDRRALSDLQQGAELEESGRAARTPVEEIVAGIWAEVLGLDQVNVDVNFFDLGGHSLLATQVVSRIRESLPVHLPLRVLFEEPTVEGLSRRIEQEISPERRVEWEHIPSVPRSQPLPLSYAQERLWVLGQLAPDAAYNLPFAFRVRGPLNIKAFERALQLLIERHEPMRTRFLNINGSPKQLVEASVDFTLPVVSLESMNDEEELPSAGE